jgi:hypothetical protein
VISNFQCTTHNAVIRFCILTGRFIPVNEKEYIRLTNSEPTLWINHWRKSLFLWRHTTPIFFYHYLACEAIGTAATSGLLCQPRVIVKMIVEKQMECRLAGETEVLGEIRPQRHFRPSQNPTWPDPGLKPGRRGGKPSTNRLSYGAALPHRLRNLL